MTKYYYIPIELELDLRQLIDYWFTRPKQNMYSVITGVYKNAEIIDNADSLIYSINILGEKTHIKRGILIDNENYNNDNDKKTAKQLIAFCLEADFELVEPSFENIFELYPEVLIFNDSKEYLNYINNP